MISEGFLSKDRINFSDFDENSDVAESIRKRVISYETEYGSVEDWWSMLRTASNESALDSEIPYIINDENVIMAQG